MNMDFMKIRGIEKYGATYTNVRNFLYVINMIEVYFKVQKPKIDKSDISEVFLSDDILGVWIDISQYFCQIEEITQPFEPGEEPYDDSGWLVYK